MNKNLLIILTLFLLTPLYGQIHPEARDALLIHKKNLWQNYKILKSEQAQNSQYRNFDALYYRLDLEVRFDPDLLTGKVKGRFRSTVDNLEIIVLDFDDNLNIISVTGPLAAYEHSGQQLIITLSKPFNTDEIFEIDVEYSGVPDPGQDRWFVFEKLNDGSDHAWTLSEPFGARYWWPCKDTPADKADSVDIIVTVPADQLVASNGILVSDVSNGAKRTFHWHEKYPISTYLVSLAVAPYVHFTDTTSIPGNDSMLLDYYVYPEFEDLAREIFPNTRNHLDVLSRIFGPYPFAEEKYGLAQFGWKSGAMEHQTISSIGRVSASWEYVYIHELGHQWFGDALTCASWTDIWLNEGFASYSEALYAEKAGYQNLPPGEESYKAYMTSQIFIGDGTLNVLDTLSLGSLFGQIVYHKGSWVLHMLRHVLGDALFFEALYNYANGQLRYGSVRTEDFIDVCEQVSGKNLQTFFDQWINYPYFPRYVFSWSKDVSAIGQSPRVRLNVLQKQTTVIYEMPVDLKFIFADGTDTLVTVENYLRDQDYFFGFDSYPVDVIFDPDKWILKDVQDQSGGAFLPDIVIENIYPNPANAMVNIDVIFWGTDDLSLKIFDINGREINQLQPYLSSKTHRFYFRWNNDDRFGRPVAAGVYFIKPVNKSYPVRDIKKVIVLK